MAGELIGINEAKTSSSGSGGSVDNIGFAIPIDKAEDSLKELMNLPHPGEGRPQRGLLPGHRGETITQDITQLYGIPPAWAWWLWNRAALRRRPASSRGT